MKLDIDFVLKKQKQTFVPIHFHNQGNFIALQVNGQGVFKVTDNNKHKQFKMVKNAVEFYNNLIDKYNF